MNNTEEINPNMPKPGTQIFCVTIKKGQLEVCQCGIVLHRERFNLTSDEFTTTQGSRYHMQDFWPGARTPRGWFERFPDDSLFLYTTEEGKLGAVDCLKTAYVAQCIKAEEALQEQARTLHDYAAKAQIAQL